MICYGFFDNGSFVGDKTGIVINFPEPFLEGTTPSIVLTSGRNDGNSSYRSTDCNYYKITNSSATVGWYGNTASTCCWIAIGRWK